MVGVNPVGLATGSGAFIDDFVSSGSGGLNFPMGMVFGSDGHLYVTSRNTDEVLRYNGTTGAFIDDFVSSGSGGLTAPRGLLFDSVFNLYVGSETSNEVLRYNGTTGAFIDDFVSSGSGGLDVTQALLFGPDGNFYVISRGTNEILRYQGSFSVVLNNDSNNDDEELIEKIKKQREEIRNKNELNEKRQTIKEIEKDLNSFKKKLNDEEKQKIKTLVSEIKEIIKKLNENPEYDKEFKRLLKQEMKETKLKIKNEMTAHEKLSKNKVDPKINSLFKSDNPEIDAEKLGLQFKNGKIKIVIKLSDANSKVFDMLDSFGKIHVKKGKHVQLTINLSDLIKLRSIDGIEKIRAPFSAIQYDTFP